MPRFRRRNNQTATCPQIPTNQNQLSMLDGSHHPSTNLATSTSESGRHQKIVDFYNRKTVAHRRTPISPGEFISDIFVSQGSGPTASSPPGLTAYPANNSRNLRSTWALRGQTSNDFSRNGQPTELVNNVFSNPETIGSFVLLQPMVVGMQGLEVRDHQILVRQNHPQVIRSNTFPETFLPIQPFDETFFINEMVAVDGPFSNQASLLESEVYEPIDDLGDEEEVQAPDVFGDDATCTICSGIFRDPRILNCGHTFCLKCLVRMHRHNRQPVIICPICREETIVYTNDLKYLTKNFVVKNLVETIRVSSKNEKHLKLQMEDTSEKETKVFDAKTSTSKEPRETKNLPLREGRVKGMSVIKQKIFVVFERSNELVIISTKTFIMGTPRREEAILLEGISNPLGMTSRENKNVLFILETSSKTNAIDGIFKSSVWKVVLPDGKYNQKLKKLKWMDCIQTGEDIISCSDGLMVMLLVVEDDKFSINFYLTENDFGEFARKIKLDGIVRPLHCTGLLGGSEIGISQFDGSSKSWMLSIINLEGKLLRNVTLGKEVQMSNLTSDRISNLFFVDKMKNQIITMNLSLQSTSNLNIKDLASKTIQFIHIIDDNKFVVCYERQISIYEI